MERIANPAGSRLLVATLLVLASCPALADDGTADELSDQIQAALKQANPEYQGAGTFTVKEGRLVALNLMLCPGISDLSPLRKFDLTALTSVNLYKASAVSDLSPLAGCRLKQLNLERCDRISDLAPLKGMPLTWFRMYACSSVADLSPLAGMPLEHLDVGLNPKIADLSPLEGMSLHDLRIDNCPQVTDISVLKGMPLEFLSLFGCAKIKDYSVLGSLPLETLYFDPRLLSEQEIAIVRALPKLKKIGTSWKDYRKEAEPTAFWARYDAGEFRADSK